MDMTSGEELPDVEVVVTNLVTRVAGPVTDADGRAGTDGTVLLFLFAAEPN
jgi:hypothetical protein